MTDRGRSGVQLLVLAAVVAVPAALLVPKVQALRAAAARAKCQGHLAQLAVALHGYADAFPAAGDRPGPAFPAGTVSHPNLPPAERLSWFVAVLPYLDQEAMAKRFDLTAGATANDAAVGPVQQFRCPSAVAAEPLTQYVGVAGVGPDAAGLLSDKRAGVFGHDRRTRLADIADGLSNTLLVLETARENGGWHRGGPATMRDLDPADPDPVGRGRAFGGLHDERLWHGSTAALADGSVRYVRAGVAAGVLAAWATTAGGEAAAALD